MADERLVATLYGLLRIPGGTDLISRSLLELGEWAHAEALILGPLLRPGDRLFDVGAYLGTFGLGLSRLAPLGRLVAVEANPDIVPLLEENLGRNAGCPHEVIGCAVARSRGALALRPPVGPGNLGATSVGAPTDPGTTGHRTVEARSLADLRAVAGDYDLLKLDVEGMEREALIGDAAYIRAARPLIWAECNEDAASLHLQAALIWLGYEPVYVAFPAFRRANFNGSQDRIHPVAYEAALLGATPDRLRNLPGAIDGEEVIVRPVTDNAALRDALWRTPRWGDRAWDRLSRPELLALLGRLTRQEAREDFLAGQRGAAR